ncbi:MAG: Asp-tRNA(Asn)/Glu-tRNA(Gln) amidotransferase subunit GatC [bacterium]
MPVTREVVDHIAELAKLALSEDERERMTRELSSILAYIDEVMAVDVEGVEPLHHVLDMTNVFREDVPGSCLAREQALRNAPDRTEEYFRVPRVIN